MATKGAAGADAAGGKAGGRGGGKGGKGVGGKGKLKTTPKAKAKAAAVPPEIAAAEESEGDPKTPRRGRRGRGGKPKLISGDGDSMQVIDDTVRNVCEGLGHYNTSVDRVCHSVEMGDYFWH